MNWIAGIELGGTQIKALAWDLDAQSALETRIEPTRDGESTTPPIWAQTVAAILENQCARFGSPPRSIGLSSPGLPRKDEHGIAFMPGRMAGLENFHWTDFLRQSILPAAERIYMLNDVQAALMAECWLGAARDCPNVLMLTLGTGVGGAARCDGRLLRGAIGRAGHVGHLCLDPEGKPGITRIPGSLEDAIGNSTIEARTGGRFSSTFDLLEAVRAGDADAERVWATSVRALACGIASLINILDPEIVLVGGGIANAGDALFTPLAEHLDAIEWRPDGHQVALRKPELSEWAGAHGAAFYAATTLGVLTETTES